jgi:hypothetical protein
MQSVLRAVVFSGITVTVLAAAEAQTITRQGSGVIARFASQDGAAHAIAKRLPAAGNRPLRTVLERFPDHAQGLGRPKDRSANGASAGVDRAGRIMRSNSRDRSGWMRPDRGGGEELLIYAQGHIFLVGAQRP